MSPEKKTLTEPPVPIRIGPATRANLETIKSSGLAKDDSAAFRAAAAALAHGLIQPPITGALVATCKALLAVVDEYRAVGAIERADHLGALVQRARAVIARAEEQES